MLGGGGDDGSFLFPPNTDFSRKPKCEERLLNDVPFLHQPTFTLALVPPVDEDIDIEEFSLQHMIAKKPASAAVSTAEAAASRMDVDDEDEIDLGDSQPIIPPPKPAAVAAPPPPKTTSVPPKTTAVPPPKKTAPPPAPSPAPAPAPAPTPDTNGQKMLVDDDDDSDEDGPAESINSNEEEEEEEEEDDGDEVEEEIAAPIMKYAQETLGMSRAEAAEFVDNILSGDTGELTDKDHALIVYILEMLRLAVSGKKTPLADHLPDDIRKTVQALEEDKRKLIESI
jgi:hypothetical protein